ncbi:MAG TPA: zinc dependent phospholipase C family protein [Acidobacteriaceae bacterium]|nr:zinc dependent phospholipase C family protein [Acidobacteriaceae bacterium]
MKGKAAVAALALLLAAPAGYAYSFLTHETLIDIAWKSSIEPVLLREYPQATPAELREARAYAYAGSTIQDAGYYPFGHELFSNLTHYVRTGDFVTNLIRDSRNLSELAFALGAMSHYVGDSDGHRYAVNVSVPREFPSLEAQYGPVVTYEEDPHAHVRTEFAFDVDQLSHGRFAPSGYLRSVGFRVPLRLLNQAFCDTYGIRLRSVLGGEFASIRSYRWSVRQLLPRVGYAEVLLHRRSFPPDPDTAQFRAFAQRLQRADKENHWEAYRKHNPSFLTRLLALVIFVTPGVGALSDLAIRGPKADTEADYVASVNRATADYARLLEEVKVQGAKKFDLPDVDLDTGYPTRPGSYKLTDETYARLLRRVTQNNARPPLGLRENILAFYAVPDAHIVTRRHPRQWKKVQKELIALRRMPAAWIPDAK